MAVFWKHKGKVHLRLPDKIPVWSSWIPSQRPKAKDKGQQSQVASTDVPTRYEDKKFTQ